MNDKITLLYNVQNEVTVLPNKFIDEYMIKADGEYVKIYLLILRLQGMGLPVDVDHLADHLELTRKDVLRALSYRNGCKFAIIWSHVFYSFNHIIIIM